MNDGKTSGLSDEEEAKAKAKILPGTEHLASGSDPAHQGYEEDKKKLKLQYMTPFVPPAFRSAASEGDTGLHGSNSEDESEAQRRAKRMKLTGPDLQQWVEELLRTGKLVAAEKTKNQLVDSTPAAEAEGSDALPAAGSSITEPPPPILPQFPLFPEGGMECQKVSRARAKNSRNNLPTQRAPKLPTLRDPKDHDTTEAVQDPRSKRVVVAAARSVVSVASISDDGTRQFSGFALRRYEHSGFVFSVIVTCSDVVCNAGRKLDPLPKLSVGLPDKKTAIEAKLLYFGYHFDLALLLVPMKEFSLDIPRLGCCPDYNQEVFVLGRDSEASLRVRHGVISWTEESDFIGRDYYMFLDGEVPPSGTGGPVVDRDGDFRGMAFALSPEPAVLSISTIVMCLEMFMNFGRIARPMHGLCLRTLLSLDVELLDECMTDHDIKSGYIVDVVYDKSPASRYGIREGNVIVSLNGHDMLSLPKLEDYLLSLGWENLIKSVSTIDLKLVVCDLKGHTRSITMPVGFSDAPKHV